MNRIARTCLIAAAAFSLPFFAQSASRAAELSISEGAASYSYDTDGFLLPDDGNAAWRVGAGSDSFLYGEQWFLRTGTTTSRLTGGVATNLGPTGTLLFTGVGGSFDVSLRYTIAEIGSGSALTILASVTNTSTEARSATLWNYFDSELGWEVDDDHGTAQISGSATSLAFLDGEFGSDGQTNLAVRRTAMDASAWQIGGYNALAIALEDGSLTTLANAVSPFGPGDVSAAFQWNASLGAGETRTFALSSLAQLIAPTPIQLAWDGSTGSWESNHWHDGAQYASPQGGEAMVIPVGWVDVSATPASAPRSLSIHGGGMRVDPLSELTVLESVVVEHDAQLAIDGALLADDVLVEGAISGNGVLAARRVVIGGLLAPGALAVGPANGFSIAAADLPLTSLPTPSMAGDAGNVANVPEPSDWALALVTVLTLCFLPRRLAHR